MLKPFFHPARMGALFALIAVGLGAFGAHLLEDMITPERLKTFETAVRYQMYHALGLIAIGALPKACWRAAPFIIVGSIIFSGSLYLLVATNVGILGAITPIGGVFQIIGWVILFFQVGKSTQEN